MHRLSCLFVVIGSLTLHAQTPGVAPPSGLRNNTPSVHALVGGRIVVAPGQVIEKGTIVLRDGSIAAVGADIEPPADARRWDASGKTIYAGFIDAYNELAVTRNSTGGYWNPRVTPQTRTDEYLAADKDLNKKLRSQGIAVRLVAPAGGIVKGISTLATTGDDNLPQTIIKEQVALHAQLTASRGDLRDPYPNSPMGAMTLVRQALYDA